MRVALINQPWGEIVPPVITGGSIPLLLYEIALRLTARGCEVAYYTPSRFRRESHTDQQVQYRYIPIVWDKLAIRLATRMPGSAADPYRPWFARAWAYGMYARQVARDLRRWDCDIAHVVNLSQAVPVIRRLSPRTRVVLHMQCEWLSQLARPLIAPRLAQCDRVLACSDFVTRRIARRFPEMAGRCATLYNGVGLDRFTPGEPREGRPAGAPPAPLRILFVGRVTPEKGVHTLLDAFGQVSRQYPQARLEIVGPDEINPPEFVVPLSGDPKLLELEPYFRPGAYREYLGQRLRAEWADRVTFSGNLPHGRPLVQRYQQADVCVVPSVWEEPFGIPVVEAMASGVPVIATRAGAFPELVVEGQTGLLVERGNAPELAEAMRRLLADAPLRQAMGQAGRRRAAQLFDYDRIVEQLLGHYLHGRQPGGVFPQAGGSPALAVSNPSPCRHQEPQGAQAPNP